MKGGGAMMASEPIIRSNAAHPPDTAVHRGAAGGAGGGGAASRDSEAAADEVDGAVTGGVSGVDGYAYANAANNTLGSRNLHYTVESEGRRGSTSDDGTPT